MAGISPRIGPAPILEYSPDPWRTYAVDLLLLSTPWIVLTAYLVFYFRNPRDLPAASNREAEGVPFVSVIVPARNEEENIGSCLGSLIASDFPSFEILVVDDQSQDRTREIVREMAEEGGLNRLGGAEASGGEARGGTGDRGRNAGGPEVRLVPGEPLPEGWFGKPWACWQGANEARGTLLLFSDADTLHAPDLLGRVVAALREDRVDALTLIGRQIMGSFWEQLIQPQFFMLLAGRYPRTDRPRKVRHWRHAIANGQYLIFKREVYKSLGGHKAVAGEVVEDLRLAQILVRGGWTLSVRQCHGLQTRMYRSLNGLVEGWSKNVATAALQTTPGWMLPVILPLSFLVGVLLWVVPPAVLAYSLLVWAPGLALTWSALATGLSLFVWMQASLRMRGNPLIGLLYPLGAGLALFIFTRSWMKGARIRWKGREYEMAPGPRTRNAQTPPRPPNQGL